MIFWYVEVHSGAISDEITWCRVRRERVNANSSGSVGLLENMKFRFAEIQPREKKKLLLFPHSFQALLDTYIGIRHCLHSSFSTY